MKEIDKQGLYLRVPIDMIANLGVDLATLYAYLVFVSHKQRRDKTGFFGLSTTTVCNTLSVNKMWFIRNRDKLADRGLIEYKRGINQNSLTLYRIL